MKHIINTYDAEILRMDSDFGNLITILKARGLYDNSLIIFTSDHGEAFGEHDLVATHSANLHNELLHVPLLIKLPKSKQGGEENRDLARGIDILPAVLDYLDIETGLPFEGINLLEAKKKEYLFNISQIDELETYNCRNWIIMDDKWKLYCDDLYNLEEDPLELYPIANDTLRDQLWGKALSFIQENPLDDMDVQKQSIPEKLKERLKSLGYIK